MKVSLSKPPDRPNQGKGQNYVPSPFQKNFHTPNPEFSLESFIRKEIEAIFYLNKKMDLQAKIEIYWKTTEQKTLELTSCSIVYSIIRDTIENIAIKLRNLIDHSFSLLTHNSKSLCKLSQTSASWQKNWVKFKSEEDCASLLNVYPPLSNAYIMMYRHVCQCSREVYNLWKIIYDCITVKDLKCDTFQQNISELLLDIFTAPTTFEPKRMLPALSLVNKCKFINADNENITKRLEYTRFQEDELAKNLMEATSAHKMKLTPQQYQSFRRQAQENIASHFSKRLDRTKIDHTISFEEVRKQYIEADKPPFKEVEPVHLQADVQDLQLGAEVRAELLDVFQARNNLLYDLEGNSSQEDDLQTYSISGSSSNKDQLIEESYEIEVEQYPFSDKNKFHDISAKLSSSTGIDDNNDHNDLAVPKNYELETPADFILQEDLSSEEPEDRQPHFNLDLSQKLVARLNRQGCKKEMLVSREHHVSYNLQKIKKKIAKQHGRTAKDSDEHSKYMHYEKQKLEKYRKELQREKDLLREVERFVKGKEIDNNRLYRMINQDRVPQKDQPKYPSKQVQEPNKYDFNKFRQEVAEETLEKLKPLSTSKNPLATLESIINKNYIVKDQSESGLSQSTKEVDDVDRSPKKMSKRQQKLRKKIEREMKEMKEKEVLGQSKEEAKEVKSQQEIQLTSFLENLSINTSNRVDWHIQESRLARWKMKIPIIRAKSPKEFRPLESKCQEKPGKSSKRKKKNRR